MQQDKLFSSGKIEKDFTFNQEVADVFDDMVNRSIPFYSAVINATADLLARHLAPQETVVDLGCSTGTTLLALHHRLQGRKIRFIGIDNAQAMLDKARKKCSRLAHASDITFQQEDITACTLSSAKAVICNYTLQFLRPLARQGLIDRIYRDLPSNGVLIVSEKTISHAAQLNRDFISIYHAFKKNQGYSDLEIAAKREALENVLIPFSVQENMQLFERAGFSTVEIFFKWFNFSSFVAIKQ